MIVHKFGGGAVKNASGVENIYEILKNREEQKVVVLSAFGKTTNKLELVSDAIFYRNNKKLAELAEEIREYHVEIINAILPPDNKIHKEIKDILQKIHKIATVEHNNYDFLYDQVVCLGEILSTKIVGAYLEYKGFKIRWIDIRNCLITDNLFREANVNLEITTPAVKKQFLSNTDELILTQGFLGGTEEGYSTTLGREGSDYTAALLANILDARETIVWKDVPGILNADPRYFDNTEKIDEITYHEAIELAYYGAKIIHPKTIKPLQNKSIPLFVKSFVEPDSRGTKISDISNFTHGVPVYIKKENQMLLSIVPRDMSFVFEERLSKIYKLLAYHRIKVNLTQNSAINFTVSIDEQNLHIPEFIEELKKEFKVLYNKGLELITIRHYNEKAINKIIKGRSVLVEQRSRHTAQFLLEK
ncbi:MAG: aspartate kinase [Bacteroidales bacterium]